MNGDHRCPRRWTFADCMFDEANWSLIVAGKRVPIESKPLDLLRELLLRAGNVVSKDELLDKIWPDVTVVEASLPTAIHKLRLALGDDRRADHLIETVPAIGYRFAVPVQVEQLTDSPAAAITAARPPKIDRRRSAPPLPAARRGWIRPLGWAGLLAAVLGVAFVLGFALKLPQSSALSPKQAMAALHRDQVSAIRRLDYHYFERAIADGWDPDTPLDGDQNNALNLALEVCEWDPGHDRHQLLLFARTMLDGGADLDRHNRWGDTPYSIAKANRHCGPNHPVTVMFRVHCYGNTAPADHCLATYEQTKSKGSSRISPRV